MKYFTPKSIINIFCVGTVICFTSCKNPSGQPDQAVKKKEISQKPETPKKELSTAFKKYWYAGDAEVTSYTLEQSRYGELRQGTAVLIYVTEPFLPGIQVKADTNDQDNIPVLKLNSTKNYLTGIYPYSIMTSSFYPVYDNQHALKLSFSSQEWCGQVYAQLNNKTEFEIKSHSYFASEADENFNLEKTHLENEIWNKIRINPKDLPVGAISMIPSLEYIRLMHKELKAYEVKAVLSNNESSYTYEIQYPELERTLRIEFSNTFPYTIERFTDSYKDGYGPKAKISTSTATLVNRIKTPYWQQNSNKDLYLRDSLGI